jgi:hypothetical protein
MRSLEASEPIFSLFLAASHAVRSSQVQFPEMASE